MDTTTPTAEQILDAASAIVIGDGVETLRYTTLAQRLGTDVDAVRRVYPVFEDLLAALFTREAQELLHGVVDNVERDPRGGLPSRIFGYALVAVFEHPFARALYIDDPAGLNRVMRSIDGVAAVPDLTVHPELLPALQDAGMVREDADPHAVAAVISVMGSGVAMSAPGQLIDVVADGLKMLLERAVDADVDDTTPGKQIFARYAERVAVNGPRR
ncbi:hypothetical protein H4J02_05185 [Protaetiibacter sp. SSC-01]|uniref:TetR/AcrR family transcriptional regulator n=1 Tax=Protaetiibacter sp. SSC-01 TaxID=2759943 RepID=UPI001656C0FC|nr:hypothetical protein [Protaetiibacter sp. SSC-01]QNO38407.1 hypothetical protein H4J02_05185 [Protaetiibacter sp. SSC-01]